jgi:putative iron-dependent peroxidase
MNSSQPGILLPVPGHSRYLEFSLAADADPALALVALASRTGGEDIVVGLGSALVQALGKAVGGLRPFPALTGPSPAIPSTQADLWLWFRGKDRGRIAGQARSVTQTALPAFRCDRQVDGFKFDRGLDLSGYEDGTENPVGEAAIDAAFLRDGAAELDGSSFVAVQQWVHDLNHFETFAQDERDNIIGRRLSDNEELDDAPASAHVKRTAQESFDPEAFLLRRSMPWSESGGEGLMFVAFGKSFDAFEAQLARMTGQEDGITDGLFRFTRPLTGSYFWCPPVAGGKLDLGAVGL